MKLVVLTSGARGRSGLVLHAALVERWREAHDLTLLVTETFRPLHPAFTPARRVLRSPVALTRLHEADAILVLLGAESTRQRRVLAAVASGRPATLVGLGDDAVPPELCARASGLVQPRPIDDPAIPSLKLRAPDVRDAGAVVAYADAVAEFAAMAAEFAPFAALCDRVVTALQGRPGDEAAASLAIAEEAIGTLMPPHPDR